MLRYVGRKNNSFVIKYVKNNSKGGINMKNTRKPYLDNIRWLTVVIVVIYHVIYMYNGVQLFGVIGPFKEHQLQDAFQYMVYPWFMALLFVVSGMSSRYYLEIHNTKVFFKTRTQKLLIPSTIGLFVFQWILGYFNMQIGGSIESFSAVPKPVLYVIMVISGIGPLWYIQVLWIFSIILIWVKKIENDKIWRIAEKTPVWFIVLLTLCTYLAAQILNTPIVTVYRFGIYGFCFFTGYFIFSHDEVILRLSKWWYLFDIIAIVLGISYTVIYFGENYAIVPVINNPLACVYCWFAILAIISTMKKYGNITNEFTQWMSNKSWGIYIFHYLLIAVVAFYLNHNITDMPVLLVYLIVGISAFAGSIILYEIISRIPIIRWCILGIKKEKKKNV